MAKRIQLFYDVMSPYTWFAFEVGKDILPIDVFQLYMYRKRVSNYATLNLFYSADSLSVSSQVGYQPGILSILSAWNHESHW